MAANLGRRPGYKRTLVKVHEQVALAAMVAIAAHGLLLLGDRWLNPGMCVPGALHDALPPVWTGIGSSPATSPRARPDLLRAAPHRRGALAQGPPLIVVVYVLGAVQALAAGSDGAGIWLRAIVVVTAVPIAALLVVRYARRAARPPRAARPTPPAEPEPVARDRVDVSFPCMGTTVRLVAESARSSGAAT